MITTQDLTRAALFCAVAVGAAVLVRFGAEVVPFSMLPFVAVFAGALLRPHVAALSMFTYLLMGLLGLPVFATPPFGGLGYVFHPTFGFLLGFILAAFVTAWLIERATVTIRCSSSTVGHRIVSNWLGFTVYVGAAMIGIFAVYLVGIPYLWFAFNAYLGRTINWKTALQIGFLPFIIPDLAKAVVAGVIAYRVTTQLPQP